MKLFFIASQALTFGGEFIKDLNTHMYVVIRVDGGCRWNFWRVLKDCMSELIENSSKFLTTNIAKDNMYCDCKGRMFSFLKRSRRDVL